MVEIKICILNLKWSIFEASKFTLQPPLLGLTLLSILLAVTLDATYPSTNEFSSPRLSCMMSTCSHNPWVDLKTRHLHLIGGEVKVDWLDAGIFALIHFKDRIWFEDICRLFFSYIAVWFVKLIWNTNQLTVVLPDDLCSLPQHSWTPWHIRTHWLAS